MKPQFRDLFFVRKKEITEKRHIAHKKHHENKGWVYYCTFVVGMWLIASPPTFGYEVPGMVWNDILTGIILSGFSYFALKPYNLWAQWGVLFVGMWLLTAPILFWAEAGAGFLTDYFTGTLLVLLGIIIPGQPGLKLYAPKGSNVPPGWSYNPASWDQRIPVIFLAWIGFFISRYMGAYQMGYIDTVWDPFFGDGTRQVLMSDVSHAFPVSDAMLGAFAYIMDVLFGAAGGTHRWRTMPWVVIIFGILIIPLGIVSVTLVILQPVAVGYWCTLCLSTAFISLMMIPFAIDEVLATIQLMIYEKKKNKTSYWNSLWFGGTMDGGGIKPEKKPSTLTEYTCREMLRGIYHVPWNLFASFGMGVFVMAIPGLFGIEGSLADSYYLTGAIVISVAVTTMSEIARPLRFLNVLLGFWIIFAPWIFSAFQEVKWVGMAAGIILILLSFRRGKIIDKRSDFDKYIV